MFKRACALFSLYLLLSGCQPTLMTGVIQLQETEQLDFRIQAESADMCLRDVTQLDLSLISGPRISKTQILKLKRRGYAVSGPVNGQRTISKRLQLTRSQIQSKGIIVNLMADFSQGATGQLSLYNKNNQFEQKRFIHYKAP